ncbi:MAG TPA: DUF3261 domain-containing protein, partial [Nannocystaceae bacterium]|nr:DUF3261 domain-containing protein [Nannocystaceae bacterium]
DADGLGRPFLARQRVIATAGGQRHSFDAVLQYDGRELLLLGLTPMGTKAFAVRQRDSVATAESFVDRPLPAPPEAILLDVHWSYFLATDAARPDGWHRRRVDGLRLRERWANGRLQQRIVAPRRGIEVDIRYVGGRDAAGFPKDVVIEHRARDRSGVDLRLEITTLTHESIAAPPLPPARVGV